MSGRPRGRPRKDPNAPVTPKAKPKPIEGIVKEEGAESAPGSSRRNSPRKRKPTNFDGFVVETPGLGFVGEGAETIEEIEEEDPIDELVMVKEEDDGDRDFKPNAPPPSAKRKYVKKKKLSSIEREGDDVDYSTSKKVRVDPVEDDDPMRRVERRGRKKKIVGAQTAPTLVKEKKVTVPPKGVMEVVESSATEDTEVESAAKDIAEDGQEEKPPISQGGTAPPSPNKSPRGSPSKTPTTSGVSRRKQDMSADDEEEYEEREEIVEEEVPEEMMEEDLVDVESFEVQTIPQRLGMVSADRLNLQHNKPFRCRECGIGYRREAYLLNHLAVVHHDECAILSAAERSAKRASRRPERMVPKERPGEAAYKFGCDLCVRRFLRWEGLVVHQKQIHKEITPAAKEQEKNRDYGVKCPVCLLYFFGNHALSEHVSREHPDHNRFIFACDICGMGFMHWARVRAHKTSIHNAPVKYTQGYLKKNPEMAKIVEAQRMRKAVERNRAKRMLEKGILSTETVGREYCGLSRSEMNEYMYLMPPTLEPEIEGEMYDDGEEEEEIVEEDGTIDPADMLNTQMVYMPASSVRRPPLPPRMMGYREYKPYSSYPRAHHQLAAIHQRVTQLDRRDLEILNRQLPSGVNGVVKDEEEELDVDVEREELIEEEVVDDDMIMDGGEEMVEEEEVRHEEEEEVEGEDVNDEDEVPPQLEMYA